MEQHASDVNDIDVAAGAVKDKLRSAEFQNAFLTGERMYTPPVLKPTKIALGIWTMLGQVPQFVIKDLRANQRDIAMSVAVLQQRHKIITL